MVHDLNSLIDRWVGAFNAISAFNNSGMSLLDANMVCAKGVDFFANADGFKRSLSSHHTTC